MIPILIISSITLGMYFLFRWVLSGGGECNSQIMIGGSGVQISSRNGVVSIKGKGIRSVTINGKEIYFNYVR